MQEFGGVDILVNNTGIALTALNNSLGQELVYYKKPFIRVSNISPDLVQTEIFKTGGFGEALEQIANL